MAAKTKSKKAAPVANDGAPVLDNSALEKLTLRIAEGLKDGKKSQGKGKKIDKKDGAIQEQQQRGKKRDRSGSLKEQEPASGEHIHFDNDEKKPAKKTSNGADSKGAAASSPNSKAPKDSKKAALLEEIIALGGTEEDLALVGELESDSDEEVTEVQERSSSKAKAANRSEIEDFMKEIGLVGAIAEKEGVVEDEQVEEEEEEGWEDESVEEDEEESEDAEEAPPAKASKVEAPVTAKAKKDGLLTVEPRPDWHKHDLPELPPTEESLSSFQIKALHERAKTLLTNDNTTYTTHNLSKSANRQFLSQIMTSGTLSDKISALTLVCQESPLHTTRSFESLLNMARKKSRSQAVAALGALKDLFASGHVLPSDRKLKAFARQPLATVVQLEKEKGKKEVAEQYLVLYAFEDWLKSYYFEVLKVLETVAADGGVAWTRLNAIGMIYELLKEKPEGEENLLRLLVNKLGDNDKKVASKTSYLLLQVQNTHPMMKPIIISSIESEVLFRPGNNQHAKYYSIITLNQTILSTKEPDVANQLLKTYFAVFAGLRQLSDKPPPEADTKEKKKLSRKAKQRLEEETKAREVQEEHNSKLVSALLTGVNRAYPFSNLDDAVFQKHMDALFRITHSANFNTSIQALMLIFQVANSKQMVSDRFYRSLYESLTDPRLTNSSKQALYLNLLFRALKADHQVKRVKAFAKRILQVSTMHQPPFVCGVLYLLRELGTSVPSLKNMFDTPEVDESDDEEVFKDAVDDDDEDTQMQTEETESKEVTTEEKAFNRYDGRKRDPLHCNADKSCLWEILPLISHFHPTVSLFARHLLENKPMPSKPDLSLHTISHFLDRFVYRNAKSAEKTAHAGGSIMQPLAGGAEPANMVLSVKSLGRAQQPVNTEAFWKKNIEDVPEDEVFFHKYFNARPQNRKEKRKGKERKVDSDDEDSEEIDDIAEKVGDGSGDESEDEGEVWDAMVASRPDLEADIDGDDVDFDDVDMDGFEDGDDDMEDVEDGEGGDFGMTTDDLFGSAAPQEKEEGDEEEEDDSDMDDVNFDDSEEDAIDSDDEIPSDIDEELTKQIEANKKVASGSSKAEEEKEDRKSKRRKLKSLPLFASADEYEALIAKGEGDEDQ